MALRSPLDRHFRLILGIILSATRMHAEPRTGETRYFPNERKSRGYRQRERERERERGESRGVCMPRRSAGSRFEYETIVAHIEKHAKGHACIRAYVRTPRRYEHCSSAAAAQGAMTSQLRAIVHCDDAAIAPFRDSTVPRSNDCSRSNFPLVQLVRDRPSCWRVFARFSKSASRIAGREFSPQFNHRR